MTVCAVCGKTHMEVRDWRPCPLKGGALICGSEHCDACWHKRKEGDNISPWCCYWVGRERPISRNNQIQTLYARISIITREMRKAYRYNNPKRGREIEEEVTRLTFELRMIEKK